MGRTWFVVINEETAEPLVAITVPHTVDESYSDGFVYPDYNYIIVVVSADSFEEAVETALQMYLSEIRKVN